MLHSEAFRAPLPRVGLGNPLAKNAGNPAIDIVHHKCGRPKVSHNILEQRLYGFRIACIAGISARAVRFLETFQDGLIRIPGGDADAHAIFREEPGTTCADSGTAAHDESNVLHGRFGVGLFRSSHGPRSYLSR